MNKIVATISLAALGTTALHAYMPGQSPHGSLSAQERTKPWSIGVELRGFYDDNYLTLSRDLDSPSSFGFDIRPSAGLNLPMEKSYFGTEVTYSAKWYEDRSSTDSPWDDSVFWDTAFNHSFTPQQNLEIDNKFKYTQEPSLTSGTTPLRSNQNYLFNRGSISYTAGLSRRAALVFGYNNNYWNYLENDVLAARLNRIDQVALVNFRYQVAPKTVTYIGYNFRPVDYTSDQELITGTGIKPDTRNSRSHIGYIGVEHSITRLMSFSIDGGIQYIDYYNNVVVSGVSLVDGAYQDTSPYGNLNYTYRYLPGSSFMVGGTIFRQSTEVLDPNPQNGLTQDVLASSIYANLSHEFSPRVRGVLLGRWQHNRYNGGVWDNDSENVYVAGLRFIYTINKFLSATAGYTLTYYDSPVTYGGKVGGIPVGPTRGYTRNLVWIGIAATY